MGCCDLKGFYSSALNVSDSGGSLHLLSQQKEQARKDCVFIDCEHKEKQNNESNDHEEGRCYVTHG